MRRSKAKRDLLWDFIFILIGIALAVFLTKIGLIDYFVILFGGSAVASFFAGIFFTSAFTLAPAAVALAHISTSTPIATVALWGGLGAMCGDLALFLFIRDRFAGDILGSLKPAIKKRILSSFHIGFLKWLSPLLGVLIIASPLPDEFGLMLLGVSKTKAIVLMPIAFVMNVAAIYSLVWFAHLV